MKEEEKLKEIIAIQKKKEKIVIRNDQIIVEKTADQGSNVQVSREKFGFLRKLLMGPIGILIWSGLFVFGLFVAYNKVFMLGSRPKSESEKQ